MMRVVFTQFAKQELGDAVCFFELEYSGLGKKYKFPYKLLYSVEKDHVLVIAIAHQHRKPDYWIIERNR